MCPRTCLLRRPSGTTACLLALLPARLGCCQGHSPGLHFTLGLALYLEGSQQHFLLLISLPSIATAVVLAWTGFSRGRFQTRRGTTSGRSWFDGLVCLIGFAVCMPCCVWPEVSEWCCGDVNRSTRACGRKLRRFQFRGGRVWRSFNGSGILFFY